MGKGRGATVNVHNRFEKIRYTEDEITEYFEELPENALTRYHSHQVKTVVNKVDSPDVGMGYSINPYQGCEHGCIYCYARNSHEYWGYSGGLDFERNIIVKENAPALLRKKLDNPRWQAHAIVLSGNTDPYQPAERKHKLTRQLLEVFLAYEHPVGIISKNSLMLRDIDILAALAEKNLLHINLSITSLDESLRRKLEPRTATYAQRLKTVEKLAVAGIPVNVMVAPIIPAINDHEIPAVIKAAADAGALSAAYTMVRLNGIIGELFTRWVQEHFPDRAERVLGQIAGVHGGKLNDSRWGKRMRGDGNVAEMVSRLFKISRNRYMEGRSMPEYNLSLFKRPERGQLRLF